ncbi:MAG: toxin-antitoxin system YwqK family antitoxin [Pirellulales bacterium]|nr:toxin-antitoxin system YwqK family antitoxin [Pirellulales bacterium]
MSEVGQIPPTPQFIQAQKVEQNYPNGQPQRRLTIHFYRDGPNLFHGDFKEWHPNGILWKQGTYDENRRVGEWKFMDEDGTLAKHAFYSPDGLPEGEWTYFNGDGSKRRVEHYHNGKKDGTFLRYGLNGMHLLTQHNYEDDKLHGKVIRWFPAVDSGEEPRVQRESVFIHGDRDGTATEWYENGVMRSQVEFKEGKRHGRTQRWDAEGNLELDLKFVDGEPVEEPVKENSAAKDSSTKDEPGTPNAEN